MRTVAQEAHASLSGDEGHGLSSRPPKGKRTVVSKYAKHACVQCRNACVLHSFYSVVPSKLKILFAERLGVREEGLCVHAVERLGTT